MKLVTYTIGTLFGTVDRLGALEGEEVIDLNSAYAAKLAAEGEPDPGTLAALLGLVCKLRQTVRYDNDRANRRAVGAVAAAAAFTETLDGATE